LETKCYSSTVTGKILTSKIILDEHFNARRMIDVTLKFKV